MLGRSACASLESASRGSPKPSVPTAAGLEVRLRPAAASDTGAMRALELDLATTRQERSAPFDYSLAVLASAIRVIDLEGEVLATAPWARTIELGDEDWLLHPDLRGRWRLWAVGQALAALIRQLQTPSTAEATAGQMADETGLDPAKLRPWVHAQLRELVQAGIVIPGPLAEALEETSGPWSSGFPGNRAIPLPEAANILPP